ncbi:MAG: Hsp70 family protein [Deltaproteobacteria bacterium]|nr:Hsp70 family protein [Deltaproteobacteria bacterium]
MGERASLDRAALDLPGLDPSFQPKRAGPIIGIDLGTTNSCAAVVREGKPRVIVSREGYTTIPSIVAAAPDGRLLIGHPAKNQLVTNPEQSVVGSKRLVGRPYASPLVDEIKLRTHYPIVEGPDGQAAVKLAGSVLTLEEIAALILNEVRDLAQTYLGQPVQRAVITCPAFYNEHQRAAVREAGRIAGLCVERVLNEPTAAALAFGYGKGMNKRAVVFDLGGGTFDATVLYIQGDKYEVAGTGGDVFLGGIDFDHVLVDMMLRWFKDEHGVGFKGDRVAMQRLFDAAEVAKCSLSEYRKFRIHIPHATKIGERVCDVDMTIAREEYEAACQKLIERSMAVLDEVIRTAGMRPQSVDDVLLVGGMTRMPMVQARLRRYFDKEPHKGVHPDEAVGLGAALMAYALEREEGVRLVDVIPMSIGVGLPAGRFKKVLPRNTALPTSRQYTIATTKANQKSVELHVFQGESDLVAENELLGSLLFDNLPRGARGDVRVEVDFRLSDECILTLAARELSTGRVMAARMSTKGTPVHALRKLGVRTGPVGTGAARPRGLRGLLSRLFGR